MAAGQVPVEFQSQMQLWDVVSIRMPSTVNDSSPKEGDPNIDLNKLCSSLWVPHQKYAPNFGTPAAPGMKLTLNHEHSMIFVGKLESGRAEE